MSAVLHGKRQVCGHRIRECTDRATGIAPAIPYTNGPAVIAFRGHRERQWGRMHALLFETASDNLALGEQRHRRHRIGLARGTPDFPPGIPRYAVFTLYQIVVRPQFVIAYRPVQRTIV